MPKAIVVKTWSHESIPACRIIWSCLFGPGIRCRSEERRKKEPAIHARFEKRIEEGLQKIEAACLYQGDTMFLGHPKLISNVLDKISRNV